MVHLSREQFAGTSVVICSPICAQIIGTEGQSMKAREFMRACCSHLISVSAQNILSMFAANAECLASELMVTFLWKCLYMNKVLFV